MWCILCVLFRVWYAFVCSYPWALGCNKKKGSKQSCGEKSDFMWDMEGFFPRLTAAGASFTLPSIRFRSRRMARRFMSWEKGRDPRQCTGYQRIHNLRLFKRRKQANSGWNFRKLRAVEKQSKTISLSSPILCKCAWNRRFELVSIW